MVAKVHKVSYEGAPFTYIDGKRVFMRDMIMETMLGRSLTPSERVMCLNGNPLDNRRNNLKLVTVDNDD